MWPFSGFGKKQQNDEAPEPGLTVRESVPVIDSNNFRQVLQYFDRNGECINSNIRFRIPCAICNTKDISLVNSKFDKISRETHEPYAVLPRCGHAFGYTCLYTWLSNSINLEMPKCPSCRQDAFYETNEPLTLDIYGVASDEEQSAEIYDIRQSLETPVVEEDPSGRFLADGMNPISEAEASLRHIESLYPADEPGTAASKSQVFDTDEEPSSCLVQ
ncbi:hypothetical protein M426DRAFT_16487 [Hypoxylon sp. CI-4A]|nr:hypothetical protein M426DRAFT_16487 [Hypoxylon sp. CI-4A]